MQELAGEGGRSQVGEVRRGRMQKLAGAGGRSHVGEVRRGRRQEPGKGRYQQEPPLQGIFMLT
jgi:hypothetical protein